MVLFYEYKSHSITTGGYWHTYRTRQRREHKQTSHSLELAPRVSQNIVLKQIARNLGKTQTEANPKLFSGVFYCNDVFIEVQLNYKICYNLYCTRGFHKFCYHYVYKNFTKIYVAFLRHLS